MKAFIVHANWDDPPCAQLASSTRRSTPFESTIAHNAERVISVSALQTSHEVRF